jgi:hypothetical protein
MNIIKKDKSRDEGNLAGSLKLLIDLSKKKSLIILRVFISYRST